MATLTIDRILNAALGQGASDVHLSVGAKPMLRVNGTFRALETVELSAETLTSLMRGCTSEHDQVRFSEHGMIDFSFSYAIKRKPSDAAEPKEVRVSVRGHAVAEFRGPALILRLLNQDVPSTEEIGLRPELVELLSRPSGLILVTGATGSGKSTTLASLMNHVSLNLRRAISTIEQPIEYEIARGSGGNASPVVQIDVPNHVKSFATGLRGVLRQDPDVIMVGELRDYETMEVALHAAETGHVVLSTLHANTAAEAFGRMLDVFPGDKQQQARTVLAAVIVGVVSQRLLPTCDKPGRALCYELLLRHSSLPNLIREGKLSRINDLVQTQSAVGMQSFDAHLVELVAAGRVDRKVALNVARVPENVARGISGISVAT